MEPAMHVRQKLNLSGTQHSKVKSFENTYTYRPCCLLRLWRSKSACSKTSYQTLFISFSAILKSQVSYRCTLVPRLPFPVPRSPFPVTSFSNIPIVRKIQKFNNTTLKCSVFFHAISRRMYVLKKGGFNL